jgi:hypothetical protein
MVQAHVLNPETVSWTWKLSCKCASYRWRSRSKRRGRSLDYISGAWEAITWTWTWITTLTTPTSFIYHGNWSEGCFCPGPWVSTYLVLFFFHNFTYKILGYSAISIKYPTLGPSPTILFCNHVRRCSSSPIPVLRQQYDHQSKWPTRWTNLVTLGLLPLLNHRAQNLPPFVPLPLQINSSSFIKNVY